MVANIPRRFNSLVAKATLGSDCRLPTKLREGRRLKIIEEAESNQTLAKGDKN
jgi:hypothetical protein